MKMKIKEKEIEYDIGSPIFIYAIAEIKNFFLQSNINSDDKTRTELIKTFNDMKSNIDEHYKKIRPDILSKSDVLEALELAIKMTNAEQEFVNRYK